MMDVIFWVGAAVVAWTLLGVMTAAAALAAETLLAMWARYVAMARRRIPAVSAAMGLENA
jgi:hypothetical protein